MHKHPALKWRTPAEKEKAFRALQAAGYKRMGYQAGELSAQNLCHSSFCIYILAHNTGQIGFRSDKKDLTLCNSVSHLIDLAKRQKIT